MEFVQPVVHVAEGAEKAEARLGKFQRGIQGVLIFLALVDPRKLLILWVELGGESRARRRHSRFQLGQHGLQLGIGYLLLEAGDFGLCIEFADVAGKRGNLDVVLLLGLLASTLARRASAAVRLALARRAKSKNGIVI